VRVREYTKRYEKYEVFSNYFCKGEISMGKYEQISNGKGSLKDIQELIKQKPSIIKSIE
jgi:hypothetical protein